MSEERLVRLQKIIARSGIASRREAERLIGDGLVYVNGQQVREQGTKILPSDSVRVNGVELAPVSLVYLAINKPRGYECSNNPDTKFPSFLNLLPDNRRSVHHVGRLDVGSEGLLLATSDGRFTQIVTHPSFEVPKYYDVWIRGEMNSTVLEGCVRGKIVEGDCLKFDDIQIAEQARERTLLRIRLHGGKNREIRRLLEAFGLGVVRLIRTRIGSVELGGLSVGKWRDLNSAEIDSFFAFQDRVGPPVV